MGIPTLLRKYVYFFSGDTDCSIEVCTGGKKASPIQYGYRKCGTHARVFSKTLVHWNTKNEIKQRNGRKW